MGKTTFAKLNLKLDQKVKEVEFNGETFDIKTYLPVNDKLNMITHIINNCQDMDNNIFVNPVKFSMFFDLEVLFTYTNIGFTDTQKKDLPKLYDICESSGLLNKVRQSLGAVYEVAKEDAYDCVEQVYTYRQSMLGVMESLSDDYKNLDLDAAKIQEKLANKDNVQFLDDVLTKLG